MTDQGFIKLHRSILTWEWYGDPITFRVFLHLLLNANWEDSKFKGYDIPRGSLVTSYASISKALNISIKNARTAIKHLITTGEVASKAAGQFSIITIVNWEKFQGYENEAANITASKTASRWQAGGNVKEYKEYKNIKNIYKANANKGMSTGYTPEFFAELEREVKEK